ncbi:ABC transporter permease [Carboxylicivirga taeanensis]|uniref:ABC transporter permease n=1 Tax=Carboxylicivirga taeanensis TaxID=1416875 RepID=UPI003F6E3D2D
MMLIHHIKVAIRSIRKQGVYAVLNIFGLALGLVLGLFVLLLVKHELSYDTAFKDSQRIYRLATQGVLGSNIVSSATSPLPLANMLKQLDEVEGVVRIIPGANNVVVNEDKRFNEDGFVFGDAEFFQLFDYTDSEQTQSLLLNKPRQVVITESSAIKYFGHTDVVGDSIGREGIEYEIIGVCKDLPSAAHFHFDFVASISTIDEILLKKADSTYLENRKNDWLYLNCYTYLKLKEKVDVEQFISQVNRKKDSLLVPQVKKFIEIQQTPDSIELAFFEQNIRNIHFESHLDGELSSNSKPIYIQFFVFVAVFVLLTTCINFINLTTAKLRVKYQEIGYRQLIGASRSQLVDQFLVEALVYGLGAMFIGMVLLELLLPFFNNFFELRLQFDFFRGWIDFFGILLVLLIVGLLAGSFPAFFFSSRKPGKLIAGNYKIGKSGFIIRGLLVTSQFAVAMFLVVVSTAMWWQINFVRTDDPGFDSENIMVIERGHAVRSDLKAFKSDLMKIKGVQFVSACVSLPGDDHYQGAFRVNKANGEQMLMLPVMYVDEDYFNVMGLRLKAGRFLSEGLGDSLGVNLNESAVEKLGLRKPLDEKLEVFGDGTLSLNTVGVVKDYQYESYFTKIKPLVLILLADKMRFDYVLVKKSATEPLDMGGVETVWKKYSDGAPFVFTDLNERIDGLYEEDVRIAKIMSVFAFISLFTALLGLVALVTFVIEYRSDVIAIKNVLGASRQSIMNQVFSMYSVYVVLGIVLAVLPAYWAIQAWASSYAYFDFVGSWVFIGWALVLMLLSVFATFIQAFKGVGLRPVNS